MPCHLRSSSTSLRSLLRAQPSQRELDPHQEEARREEPGRRKSDGSLQGCLLCQNWLMRLGLDAGKDATIVLRGEWELQLHEEQTSTLD
mmetsp:Transcript_10888/g.23456  ORF Transcript_10888/g.23456 Transcript_10888/m.23456 type:complete len:89 (+) Transcript_10888:116-382(+)